MDRIDYYPPKSDGFHEQIGTGDGIRFIALYNELPPFRIETLAKFLPGGDTVLLHELKLATSRCDGRAQVEDSAIGSCSGEGLNGCIDFLGGHCDHFPST